MSLVDGRRFTDQNKADQNRSKRRWKQWRLSALCLLIAVGTAGCGSPARTASQDAPADNSTAMVAYAQCMRANGVPDFPDPDSNGNMRIVAKKGSGLDMDSTAFKAASQKCQDKLPAGKSEARSGEAEKALEDQLLAYAKCIRANGVPDFPDPEVSDGRVMMKMGQSASMNSAAFQAAQKACESQLPGRLVTRTP